MIKIDNNTIKLLSPTRTLVYVCIGDYTLCFSYATLIGITNGKTGVITDRKYSATTSHHKHRFAEEHPEAQTVPDFIFLRTAKQFLTPLLDAEETQTHAQHAV